MRRLLAWLTCWDIIPLVFIHSEIRVVQEFGGGVRKLRCDRCGKYFGMNDRVEAVLPWDEEMEHEYAVVLGYGRTIK